MKANYINRMKTLDIIKKQKKDLGFVSTKLKFDENNHLLSKKANKQIGIIIKVFAARKSEAIIPSYKSFVRT